MSGHISEFGTSPSTREPLLAKKSKPLPESSTDIALDMSIPQGGPCTPSSPPPYGQGSAVEGVLAHR